MNYDAPIKMIEVIWDKMYRTVGQDQWPCDLLMSIRGELKGNSRSGYATGYLKKNRDLLLELTIGDEAKGLMNEALEALFALRLSRRGKRA